MPDLDIIDRSVKKHWRPPFRLAREGAQTDQVAGELHRSLVRSLVDEGGVLSFDDLADVLEECQLGQINRLEAHDRISRIEQTALDLHTKIVARATRKLLIDLPHVLEGECTLRQLLSEKFCWEMLDYHFFDSQRLEAVGRIVDNYFEYVSKESELKASLNSAIVGVANELARNPLCPSLQQPRKSRRSKKPTKDILHDSTLVRSRINATSF